MKFSEAVAHYEQGKSIRKKSWLADCHYNPNGGNIRRIDLQDAINSDWELFDDKVEVETLKEGDLFEHNHNQYRVCPAYIGEYLDVPLTDQITVIRHNGFSRGCLCYLNKETKVTKL